MGEALVGGASSRDEEGSSPPSLPAEGTERARSLPEPKPPRPPLPLRLKKPLATLREGTGAGTAAEEKGGRAEEEATAAFTLELPPAEELRLAVAAGAPPWTRPSADSEDDPGRGTPRSCKDEDDEGDRGTGGGEEAPPASAGAEVERGLWEPRRRAAHAPNLPPPPLRLLCLLPEPSCSSSPWPPPSSSSATSEEEEAAAERAPPPPNEPSADPARASEPKEAAPPPSLPPPPPPPPPPREEEKMPPKEGAEPTLAAETPPLWPLCCTWW